MNVADWYVTLHHDTFVAEEIGLSDRLLPKIEMCSSHRFKYKNSHENEHSNLIVLSSI